MNITIKQANIKNSLFLAYKYDQVVKNAKKSASESSDAPIHDDLRNAFSALIPHLAFICEEIKEEDCQARLESPDDELPEDHFLLKYRVHGFSISGQGDQEGLTIAGTKRLESGKILNLDTPFQKFDDINDYAFMAELRESIENLKSEVYEYLEGKQAPAKQQVMELEEDEVAM